MVSEADSSDGLGKLRGALVRFKPGQRMYDEIVAPRDQVFARYRPIFSAEHLPELTKEEFTSFLYSENNRHWTGLYRQGLGAAGDMERLRQSLGILLDENRPIAQRFPEALDMVAGLGKGIATAILTVAYPESYGVWNNASEAALRQVELWPRFERGEGVGGRYEKINAILVRLSTDLKIDLWTLDALLWFLLEPEEPPLVDAGSVPPTLADTRFALERQLEAFLLENWDQTPLGKDWEIFKTPEDSEAGNQFPTDVGRIDILARHRVEPRLLVVELKRNQSNDQTVGQVLRYLGWVQKHLTQEGETVEGLIIAHKGEKEAQYALLVLPNVKMMTYEVEFRLNELEPLLE